MIRITAQYIVVTDNGSQYTSFEFSEFTKSNEIKHSFLAPHHPATNGAAENFVHTFKDKVTKIIKSGKSLECAIALFLFDYRALEHCKTGRSSAYLMYKRERRTRFDLLRPEVGETVVNKRTAQIIGKRGKRNVNFQVGEVVLVYDFSVRNENVSKVQSLINYLQQRFA